MSTDALQLYIVGLGKMGMQASRLLACHNLITIDPNVTTSSFSHITDALRASTPSEAETEIVFCLFLADSLTTCVVSEILKNRLSFASRPLVLDLSNANYKASAERFNLCQASDVEYRACGISGGVSIETNGDAIFFDAIGPQSPALTIITALARGRVDATVAVGKNPNGHLVKCIHNAYEYAELAILGNTFDVLTYYHPSIKDKLLGKLAVDSFSSYLAKIMSDEERGNYMAPVDVKVGRVSITENGSVRSIVEYSMDRKIPIFVIASGLMTRYLPLNLNSNTIPVRQYIERPVDVDFFLEIIRFVRTAALYECVTLPYSLNDLAVHDIGKILHVYGKHSVVRGSYWEGWMNPADRFDSQIDHISNVRSELTSLRRRVIDLFGSSFQNVAPMLPPIFWAALSCVDNFSPAITNKKIQSAREKFGGHLN